MARKTASIQLTGAERRSLKTRFRAGHGKHRQQTRARILDLLDRKLPPPQIAETLSCSIGTVYNVKNRYLAEGLQAALLAQRFFRVESYGAIGEGTLASGGPRE